MVTDSGYYIGFDVMNMAEMEGRYIMTSAVAEIDENEYGIIVKHPITRYTVRLVADKSYDGREARITLDRNRLSAEWLDSSHSVIETFSTQEL